LICIIGETHAQDLKGKWGGTSMMDTDMNNTDDASSDNRNAGKSKSKSKSKVEGSIITISLYC